MRTSRVPRIKQAFLGALSQPESCREAYIRRECAEEPEIRDEALRLLRLRLEVTGGDRAARSPRRPSGDPTETKPLRLVDDEPGSGHVLFDRYELGDIVGAGGFGTVYRARDSLVGCDVAVKTVALSSTRAVEWHRREVASLLRAQIPGVVELRATGESRGWGVVVMTLVDGAAFPGRGVAIGDVATILPRAAALLEAVGYLHAAGVLHRDLKPANVLVDGVGEVTLVDLGIAEDVSDTRFWSQTEAAGTPTYMAPELGSERRASVRSDLYSAAVIIVEALTGEVPDRTVEMPRGALGRYSTAARERLEHALPAGVFTLLARALDDDPEQRPSDARAVADAIRAAFGSSDAVELPATDDGGAARVLAGAARDGRRLDLVGVSGSGRTRILREVVALLEGDGFLVSVVGPGDEGVSETLERSVADGAVVVVDDYERLDASTRRLVDELGERGAVLRALSGPADGVACVTTRAWSRDDLQRLVRSPERLFHLRSALADVLMARTDGNPREIAREIRAWCRIGLARWNGGLEVEPRGMARLRGLAVRPGARQDAAGASEIVQETWSALSIVGAPIDAAALAEVVARPLRAVLASIDVLRAEGIAAADGDGRVRALMSSPWLVDVSDQVRLEWSARIAKHLPPASEARFRHLVVVGDRLEACRTACDVSRAQLERGRITEAIGVLDSALALARECDEARGDVLAELLGLMADACVSRHQASAIRLALHHATLARDQDVRVEAWRTILSAALTTLGGSPKEALAMLEAAPSQPTELHQRVARAVAQHASRMTRELDVQRSTVAETARWARRTRGREARSFLASSLGWLRFEEGRFDQAHRLHVLAMRRTLRMRTRLIASCNASSAALEAGQLEAAAALANDALALARSSGETIHEARAELLLRQALYRRAAPLEVDTELLDAANLLDSGAVRGALRLNEAAVAWRSRRLRLAAETALGAATDLRREGLWAAALLASALAGACAGAAPDRDELLERVRRSPRPGGLVAQAVALLGLGAQDEPALVGVARSWLESAPNQEMRREVLSPREATARMDRVS